jgi:hypothetical protein
MPSTRANVTASFGSAPSANNPVINGAFDIWQRGTSFTLTASNTYTADRWTAGRGGSASGQTVSRQTVSDSTNLPAIQYCARSQRANGNTSTAISYLVYSMESVNCIPFAGKTVTFSYYARRGANYSASGNALGIQFDTGTGTDQSPWSGFTGLSTLIATSVTLTTTMQRFTHTITIPATATQMGFYFTHTPTGTAGADDWFEVTGVQIDVGSVALPFRRSGGTLQGELAACQRYYYLHSSGSTKPIGLGSMYSATQLTVPVKFPVTMRTDPTLSATSGTDYFSFYRNSTFDTFNSFTLDIVNTNTAQVYNASEISGTAGQVGHTITNNASASLAFSAEL